MSEQEYSASVIEAARRAAVNGLELRWVLDGIDGAEVGVASLAGTNESGTSRVCMQLRQHISWARCVYWLFLMLIIEQSFMLPVILGFGSTTLPRSLGFWISQIVFDAVFMGNVLWKSWLRFNFRGVKKIHPSVYLLSVSFVADVFSAIPCYGLLFAVAEVWNPVSESQFNTVQALLWISMARLTQLYELGLWFNRLKASKLFSSIVITFFVLSVSWLLFVHVAGCIFFWIGSYEQYVSNFLGVVKNSNYH